jgi:hypothetical protein
MTKKWFLGRELTEREASLHADGKCIVCGRGAHVVQRHDKSQRVDFECNGCFSARTNYSAGAPTAKSFGAAGASVGHEYRRRLGYSSGSGGMGGRDEE